MQEQEGEETTARFKCPKFSPYSDANGLTWIKITTKEIRYQTAFGEGDEAGGLVLGEDGPDFLYLAPPSVMENINNSWEAWETVSSRLAGKGKEFVQIAKEIEALSKAMQSTLWKTNIGEAFRNLSSVKRNKIKIDTPLVYENSERREWTLQFNLTSTNATDAEEMMKGIGVLKESSMPLRTDASYGLGIELPYAFKLYSYPGGYLINTSWTALISVQPTYMAPYDTAGRPMRVELTLTFKELPPLYAKSHETEYTPWWDDWNGYNADWDDWDLY